MKHLLVKFAKEKEGSILEYLILIAIVAVIAAFMFPQLRSNISTWFNDMIGNVTRGISGQAGETNGGATDGGTTGF